MRFILNEKGNLDSGVLDEIAPNWRSMFYYVGTETSVVDFETVSERYPVTSARLKGMLGRFFKGYSHAELIEVDKRLNTALSNPYPVREEYSYKVMGFVTNFLRSMQIKELDRRCDTGELHRVDNIEKEETMEDPESFLGTKFILDERGRWNNTVTLETFFGKSQEECKKSLELLYESYSHEEYVEALRRLSLVKKYTNNSFVSVKLLKEVTVAEGRARDFDELYNTEEWKTIFGLERMYQQTASNPSPSSNEVEPSVSLLETHDATSLDKLDGSTSIEATLAQRKATHGDYAKNSGIYCKLQEAVSEFLNDSSIPSEYRLSVNVILQKLSRIAGGNPAFTDHWHDIEGYARLAKAKVESDDNS